ncbi:DUF2809 domain-containing protein [Cryobacterium sp. SO2]|uniref:ribosomal maturation YjgA family protein n=1 Tax=Cryobacterium sp. SO2 TaxID=1897060 RepID=UPI00223DE798|nr:DUF2809 domain-containing protein [Cryobacterium sp. SO2]WEO76460.1 DUF2809 domain-containing protein [Cryobacterium sp. SO2]
MKRNNRVPATGSPRPESAPADAHRSRDLLGFTAEGPADIPAVHRRTALAAAAGLIVVTGLVVHFAISGPAGDFVADALYAVLAFLVLSFVFVRARSWRVAVFAFALCVGIELFQLTGAPAGLAEVFPPARLLFGTTFSAIDLVAYLVGTVGAALVSTWRRLD